MGRGHCRAIAILALLAGSAFGGEISLIGVFPGKAAVIAIDGGPPKTVKVGQTWSGVTVREVERSSAVVEFGGKRRSLALGQHYRSASGDASARQTVTLVADSRGHFIGEGTVNGVGVRFLVDTGATMVSLSAADAQRLGLDYRGGKPSVAITANGRAKAWQVKLNTVRLGPIELHNVDAIVLETGSEIALLGMSFLNRVEMSRDGESMVLVRRY